MGMVTGKLSKISETMNRLEYVSIYRFLTDEICFVSLYLC